MTTSLQQFSELVRVHHGHTASLLLKLHAITTLTPASEKTSWFPKVLPFDKNNQNGISFFPCVLCS